MDLLNALAPHHPMLWPAVFAITLYGARYLIMASVTWLFARPTPDGGWGRAHVNAPVRFNARLHIRRELLHSMATLLIFGMVNAALFGWGGLRASQMYFRLREHGMGWFILSIPLMLLLHDTFFYWTHRAMHTRLLFGVMHRLHHKSVHPTAFAAYSFHPTEALAEALIVTAIIFIVPVHPLAFLIFQTISTAYNVYGHCGRELYPAGTAHHWLGRWINTSTAHAAHHGKGRYNYGLYFMFWDRAMGTLDPAYK